MQRTVRTAESALLSGAADTRVSQSLRHFVQAGRDYADSLTRLTDLKPERAELAYLSKNATITRQLESAATADERIATVGALLEGAGIVGVMSLIVIPGRVWNLRNPGSPANEDDFGNRRSQGFPPRMQH